MLLTHKFTCGNICDIEISNSGIVTFAFKTDISENQLREYCSIFIYFLSICNGFNCEFEKSVEIDDFPRVDFFDYAKEDETILPIYKNEKFFEISLFDLKDSFGNILYNLFTMNRMLIQTLLSNYYSSVVYKDFIGNGVYHFRNMVTNIESIMTLINKEQYEKSNKINVEFYKNLKVDGISKTKLNKHLMVKSVNLEQKLNDMYEQMEKYGLVLKEEYKSDCDRIVNTRNFISHIFENTEKSYLNENEMRKYLSIYREIFRMLFLEYCGVKISLIKNKFLNMQPIRNRFAQIFDIVK